MPRTKSLADRLRIGRVDRPFGIHVAAIEEEPRGAVLRHVAGAEIRGEQAEPALPPEVDLPEPVAGGVEALREEQVPHRFSARMCGMPHLSITIRTGFIEARYFDLLSRHHSIHASASSPSVDAAALQRPLAPPTSVLLPNGDALAEVLGHVGEGHHAHAGMRQHVIDQALQHHQHMRLAGAVGMDGDREDRVVEVAVDPVELVLPDLLELARR